MLRKKAHYYLPKCLLQIFGEGDSPIIDKSGAWVSAKLLIGQNLTSLGLAQWAILFFQFIASRPGLPGGAGSLTSYLVLQAVLPSYRMLQAGT